MWYTESAKLQFVIFYKFIRAISAAIYVICLNKDKL